MELTAPYKYFASSQSRVRNRIILLAVCLLSITGATFAHAFLSVNSSFVRVSYNSDLSQSRALSRSTLNLANMQTSGEIFFFLSYRDANIKRVTYFVNPGNGSGNTDVIDADPTAPYRARYWLRQLVNGNNLLVTKVEFKNGYIHHDFTFFTANITPTSTRPTTTTPPATLPTTTTTTTPPATLPTTTTTTTPPATQPTTTSTTPVGGQTTRVYLTGYGYHDNDCNGGAGDCTAWGDNRAGGTGTYDDPITLAVAHNGNWSSPAAPFIVGTKVYIPRIGVYAQVEDGCASCTTKDAIENGSKRLWIDIWVDGRNLGDKGVSYMNSITGFTDVIINPPRGLAVKASGPLAR